MAKGHGNQIKDDAQYEAMRDKGMSKEKSARIANSDSHETGKKVGGNPPYEEWTKDELAEKASEAGIDGR